MSTLTMENPSKPKALTVHVAKIPEELKRQDKWVVWDFIYKPGAKKPWTKPPYQANRMKASVTDPSTWCSFGEAEMAYLNNGFAGIGFVLDGTGVVGIDLDNCASYQDGWIEPWAQDIVTKFPGEYIEWSPTGTGLHIVTGGKLPPGRRRTGDVEMYDNARYLTFTGHRL